MDSGELAKQLVSISDYSDWIPAILLLIFSRKERVSILLIIYLFLNAVLHAFTIYFGSQGQNNMWLYQIIGLAEVILIFLYFSSLFYVNKWVKTLFLAVLVYYITDCLYWTGIDVINNYSRSVAMLFITILAIFYFFNIYKEEVHQDLIITIDFWVVSAMLIFSAGGFFAFLLSYESLFNANNSWHSDMVHGLS